MTFQKKLSSFLVKIFFLKALFIFSVLFIKLRVIKLKVRNELVINYNEPTSVVLCLLKKDCKMES